MLAEARGRAAAPRGAHRRPAAGALTAREREIAELIEQGFSNKEIAERLEIGLPTVKNHVHNILTKLKATRRGQAAAMLRGDGSLADSLRARRRL